MADPTEVKLTLPNLEEFERAVYCRDKKNRVAEIGHAVGLMLAALRQLREGSCFQGQARLDTASLTRFASAIAALFADPDFVITQDGFNAVCAERGVMDVVFRASAYGNSDHIVRWITPDTENSNKFLPLLSASSELNFDYEAAFKKDPQATVGLWLSLVGHGQIFTPAGDARREKLLALGSIFEKCVIPNGLYNLFCGAYMHCSYAHGRDKHAVKRILHRIMLNTIGILDRPKPDKQPRKERPTILMLFEWWWSKHAMYRSYAKSIEQLRKDFKLIGMCPGKNTDPKAKELFDEWIELDGTNIDLSDIAKKIKTLAPDIIYYPSIGMAVWVIAMASLRLAPIQVMTYGHPATSNSPNMDYGIIESDCLVPERFSEKMIGLPPNTVKPTRYVEIGAIHKPRKTDTLKIGVAAMQVKVTWPFIRCLQEVCQRSQKKVEVWFFSACHGVGLYSMGKDMESLLPAAVIQEAQPYEEYMASLASCDLALFSFPFGGANSCYDALELGVPFVSLEGDEPHSKSDASILRRAGLPESLVTHSEQEYVDAILKMQDDNYRALLSELMRKVPMQEKFFKPDDSDSFLEAFRTIYRENTL